MLARSLGRLLRQAGKAWSADAIPRFSAALAFYTFFSLAPLLTIAIAISAIFFGRDAAEGRIYLELKSLTGPETASAVQALVRSAWQPGQGAWAMVMGVAVLLVGATGVLNELKGALDHIWGVRSPASVRVLLLDQTRLLGFLLGIGFLLVVSLLLSASIAAMGQYCAQWLIWPELLLHALDLCIEWVLIIFVFAAIFKWLPDARIAWKDVWTGAAFTSFLFLAGKFALTFYLGHSGLGTLYGAAGSLSVLLIWVYYSALIFYFGAEFTKVYANTYGSHVKGR